MSALKQLERKAAGVIAIALPLSLVIFTYERELVPLYGSGPLSYLLDKVVLAAMLFAAVQPFQIAVKWNLLAAGVALTIAPNATYWVGVWTARKKDALWGPATVHGLVLAPLAFILTSLVVEMEDPDAEPETSARPSPVLRVLRSTITFLISFLLHQRMWYPSAALFNISGSQIFLGLAAVFYGLSIWSASFSDLNETKKPGTNTKKKKTPKTTSPSSSLTDIQIKTALSIAFAAVWWAVHPFFSNPVLPHPLQQVYSHPTFPLQILSAEQSVTGLITVAEWLPPAGHEAGENEEVMHSARYLRASHSLLGGVWVRDKVQMLDNEPPVKDFYGSPLGDSIYSAFVLQEAVRLVNSTKVGKTGQWKNALVIGLGTGISANAFLRNSISTTIVEIDPAVYNAARTWFGLADPGPGKVFIEDARAWAAEKHASLEAGNKETKYEIVVHDCFSGGGVPEHIFTVEFWNDLKAVMAKDAVLVVNFAGILKSDSSRFVISTLEKSFGQCRAFHDSFGPVEDDKYDTEFLNMVLFCTRSSEPLTFRRPRRSDWLGSPLRRHILQSLDSREVKLDLIRPTPGDERYVLTDEQNPLGTLQQKQGSHHWEVMRDVLSDTHWETY